MRTKTILAVVLLVALIAAASTAMPPYKRHKIIYVRAAVTDTTVRFMPRATYGGLPDAAQISVSAGDVWVKTYPGANFFKLTEDKAITLPALLDSVIIYRSTGTSTETIVSAFWE